jgi:hypothetical protein
MFRFLETLVDAPAVTLAVTSEADVTICISQTGKGGLSLISFVKISTN